MSTTNTFFDIPVPEDLTKIRSIHDGTRWLNGIRPQSIQLNDGVLTFLFNFKGKDRRVTIAADLIGGYQCDA